MSSSEQRPPVSRLARIVTVSLETMKVVGALPTLDMLPQVRRVRRRQATGNGLLAPFG